MSYQIIQPVAHSRLVGPWRLRLAHRRRVGPWRLRSVHRRLVGPWRLRSVHRCLVGPWRLRSAHRRRVITSKYIHPGVHNTTTYIMNKLHPSYTHSTLNELLLNIYLLKSHVCGRVMLY